MFIDSLVVTRVAMRFPAKITSKCIWVAIPVDGLILHWYACGADGRSLARCKVTWLLNFLGWVDLLTWCFAGAPLIIIIVVQPGYFDVYRLWYLKIDFELGRTCIYNQLL